MKHARYAQATFEQAFQFPVQQRHRVASVRTLVPNLCKGNEQRLNHRRAKVAPCYTPILVLTSGRGFQRMQQERRHYTALDEELTTQGQVSSFHRPCWLDYPCSKHILLLLNHDNMCALMSIPGCAGIILLQCSDSVAFGAWGSTDPRLVNRFKGEMGQRYTVRSS